MMDNLSRAKRIFKAQQEQPNDNRDDLMEAITAASIAQAEFLQSISIGINDLIEAVERQQPKDEKKQIDEELLKRRFYVTNTATGYAVYDRKQNKSVISFDGSIDDAYGEAKSYEDYLNDFPDKVIFG